METTAAAPANIILIALALDTLRASQLGCYGYRSQTGAPISPTLDAFAAQGVLFEEFISPHIPTTPGFTTMFTGKDAISHQIVQLAGRVEPDPAIPCAALNRTKTRGDDVRAPVRGQLLGI